MKAGQAVSFRVNGYADAGIRRQVRRVNPTANATTRQVEVLVDFAGRAAAPRVAGPVRRRPHRDRQRRRR